MTYDYFNTGKVAFGAKLAKAFNSLNTLADTALIRINENIQAANNYNLYVGRNYQVSAPNGAKNPVRVDELFNALKGIFPIYNIEVDYGYLTMTIYLIDNTEDKITVCTGSTSISEGYCFGSYSNSNSRPLKALRFSESNKKESEDEILLFKFTLTQDELIMTGSAINAVIKLTKKES